MSFNTGSLLQQLEKTKANGYLLFKIKKIDRASMGAESLFSVIGELKIPGTAIKKEFPKAEYGVTAEAKLFADALLVSDVAEVEEVANSIQIHLKNPKDFTEIEEVKNRIKGRVPASLGVQESMIDGNEAVFVVKGSPGNKKVSELIDAQKNNDGIKVSENGDGSLNVEAVNLPKPGDVHPGEEK